MVFPRRIAASAMQFGCGESFRKHKKLSQTKTIRYAINNESNTMQFSACIDWGQLQDHKNFLRDRTLT
jgi:hypothetical protein